MAAPLNNKASALFPSSPSSSSPSLPCRPNPRPRNSESGDPMRRSFGGSPFPTGKPAVVALQRGFHNPIPTPANSPSDCSWRNSTGRESSRRELADKENDKDQFSNMARAPPTQKGAKNFMSPTISAASKINASPRKKVLAEKNEGPRSSVSFSDVRGLILEETKSQPARPTVSFSDVVSIIGEDKEGPTPEMGLNGKPQAEDHPYDMTITDLDKEEALESKDSNPNDVVFDETKGSVDFDPSFKISPRPTVAYASPVVAPLDADPLVLPYDPKRNYLSPRPQFLHYRPNPRVEHYFDECKQLEDIFTSESSSDTEASKDERQSENSEEPEEVASQESEAVAEEEEEDEVVAKDDDDVDEEMAIESDEADRISKPRRFRAFGWLLVVLAVAYFSVSATISSPESKLSVLRDSGLYYYYIPPEFTESAREIFEQFGQKLRMWAESSGAYVAGLISSLGEEEEEEQCRLQHFCNSTDLLEDGSSDSVFQTAKAEISIVGLDHRAVMEDADEENDYEAEDPLEQFSEGNVQKTSATEFHEESEMFCKEDDASVAEAEAPEVQEAVEAETDKIEEEEESGRYESEATYEEDDHNNNKREETETGHEDLRQIAEDVGGVDSSTETTEAQPETGSRARPEISEGSFSKHQTVVLVLSSFSALVVVVLAASAFFLAKKANPAVPDAAAVPPVTEEPSINHAAAVQNMIKERFSSLNFKAEAEERSGESSACPTEMSSFYSRNKDQSNEEAQSSGGGARKRRSSGRSLRTEESLASSASEYSTSYGSFTTYEKIPFKSGIGEEEAITTPVRRSSRIRNQHSAH